MPVEPEPLPDLSTLSDENLLTRIRELEKEEDAISFRRRVLHGRIDILRAEYVSRLRQHVSDADALPEHEPAMLERPIFEGTGDLPVEHELEPLPDLPTIRDAELREMIHELEREEDDVSLRRRFLQGQIDILRAARYARLRSGSLDVSELARVLSSHGKREAGEPE
jgi:anti-sigma-K factor RsiG